jgi:hypothetical protein
MYAYTYADPAHADKVTSLSYDFCTITFALR